MPSKSKHKLAAIMFTDMVGYTSLMQEDEDKARELIERHRAHMKPFVGKHGGEIIQYVGDGTFCRFDSAIEAVNSALEIQKVLEMEPEINLRIGIHVGDVVVKGDEVYVDGVNVASRLEPLAEAGGICVSHQVYENIKNQPGLSLSSLGKKALKNVDEEIEVFAVTPATEPSPVASYTKKPSPASSKINMKWIAVAAVVTILVIVGLKIDFGTVEVESKKDINSLSIAVLPFDNMSSDPENEFFADGITEDILAQIAKIKSLQVISRTSIMQYKNTTKSLSEIGKELGVATILEGSVRRGGNRVRIIAQLIDTETDKHLWAETYDRDLDDIFAIQSDVALKIAAALQATLSIEEAASIKRKPTDNLEAYDFYLKGRSLFYTYERTQNDKAIEMFEKALSLDSSFSLAYSGLSLSYSQFSNSSWDNDEKWIILAENAARRAIELNDNSAEAHFALGFVHEQRVEVVEMEREMRRVLDLNPNHAHAHDSMGDILHRAKGQLEEAIREYEMALTLDPLLLPAFWNSAIVKLKQGKYNDAEEILLKSLGIRQTQLSLLGLGQISRFQGKNKQSIEFLKSVLVENPNSINAHIHLCLTYASFGKLDEARKEADIILNFSNHFEEYNITHLYLIGKILLEEGKLPNALESLKLSLKEFSEVERTVRQFYGLREDEILNAIAETYLKQNDYNAALEGYHKLNDIPLGMLGYGEHMWARKHYKLGTIYEQTNDSSSAIKEYETFLQLWKDADEEIPERRDTIKRLAALKQDS